jgi:large subunit ribosomal protein L3
MAGHMGQDNVTTLNLTVFRVDVERGLILLKGAVPGTEGTFVKIRDAVKSAPPKDLPFPGAIKTTASAATAAPEAPAETPADESQAPEASNGGEEQ